MKINPEEVLVRSCRDGSYVIEDDEFNQLFVLYPDAGPAEMIAQVVRIANRYHAIGKADGRREIRDEFQRLMGRA